MWMRFFRQSWCITTSGGTQCADRTACQSSSLCLFAWGSCREWFCIRKIAQSQEGVSNLYFIVCVWPKHQGPAWIPSSRHWKWTWYIQYVLISMSFYPGKEREGNKSVNQNTELLPQFLILVTALKSHETTSLVWAAVLYSERTPPPGRITTSCELHMKLFIRLWLQSTVTDSVQIMIRTVRLLLLLKILRLIWYDGSKVL